MSYKDSKGQGIDAKARLIERLATAISFLVILAIFLKVMFLG